MPLRWRIPKHLLKQFVHAGSIESESRSGLFAEFIHKCESLISQTHQSSIARFEWVDGMLIHAVEQGKWLVLDNANLCSPSVLDRLNSLLELNGYLIVNEHSDKDGEPKLVRPHPNFRLFLTMDPRHGELSRAMRNRGMEIYMDSGSMNPMMLVAEIDDNERLNLAQYSASATESSMALYRDVNRFIGTEVETHVYENLAWIIFGHLPRDQMGFLGRWKNHIATSRLSSEKLGIVTDVVNSLEHLRNHPRVGKLLEDFLGFLSHELSLSETFGKAQVSDRACLVSGIECFAISGEWKTDRFAINKQSINPIRNTSLLSPSTKKKYELEETVVVLNRIYECTREVFGIKKVEEDILHRSTTTRMKEMTFLEKSASKNKSAPGFGGSVGLPLFGFS